MNDLPSPVYLAVSFQPSGSHSFERCLSSAETVTEHREEKEKKSGSRCNSFAEHWLTVFVDINARIVTASASL